MRGLLKKYRGTILGILFITIGMSLFFIFQIYELWEDYRDPGPSGFCEYFDPTLLVGEPINAWSNFYYVGAGMILLIYYDLFRMNKIKKKETYIDKDENLHYIVIYSLLVIWVGIASFYMHASYSGFEWEAFDIKAGFLDVLSMNMYLSGVFIISISVLFGIKARNFYLLLLLDFILVVIIMKTDFPLQGIGGNELFVVIVILTFFNEVILSLGIHSKVFKKLGARQVKRNTIFLGVILGSFLTAFWLWHFGRRDAPSCDPYSLWQWHAVWHFITACCTIIIAFYLRTEKEVNPS